MPDPIVEEHYARITKIADEVARWPDVVLIERLCHEAEAACCADPDCAIWFFAVRNAGLDLISEGGWEAARELPEAIDALGAALQLKRMQAQFQAAA